MHPAHATHDLTKKPSYHNEYTSFFKTYDCRGRYGKEATEENCSRLGAASGFKEIVLGMDFRLHNDSLVSAFLQGFSGSVRFAGHAPSPLIAYNSVQYGVSFTASHNPPGYNGVKFKKEKRCFFEEDLFKIKKKYDSVRQSFFSKNVSLPRVDENLEEGYANALPEIKDGVFDLAGGAACALKQLFPNVLFGDPDPLFAKHAPEPKEDTLNVLQKKTVEEKKVGFALDGDADRCVVVDQCHVVDGGILAAFIATHLPKHSRLLLTLDTQAEVFRFLKDSGLSVQYTPVGDVYIVKKMLEIGADFAAERSGHYSFKKHMPDSDGIYAAAFLSGTRPGEVLDFSKQFKSVFVKAEVHFVVDFAKLKAEVEQKALRVDAMDGVKAEFDDFTFLVRASKTEPKVRINVEAQSQEKAKAGLRFIEDALARCRIQLT